MAETGADVLVETIMRWGVDTIFGLPGDGVNGVIEALRKRQDKVKFIQVRHEESAAFMACAYGKYTCKIGCCVATSGPGAIHLLNGLYDAKCDQAPVLAICGQTYSDLKGSHYQQDINLTRIFEDVSVYVQEVISPNQIEMLANEACRHALAHRGVSTIVIPIDYQTKAVDHKYSEHKGGEYTSSVYAQSVVMPEDSQLRKAAEILNSAKKPALLVGAGALKAGDEVIAVAEKLNAPIVKSLLGKAVVPDEHPFTTGGLGLLGTAPSETVMEECDVLLMVGSSFPYQEYLPKPKSCRGVQIDDKADRIGLRFPVEVGLVGDAKASLAALLPYLNQNSDDTLLKKAQEEMESWWELMEERSMKDDIPIKPQRAAWELNDFAEPNAIISGDSGTNTSWIAQQFKMLEGQMFTTSGTLAIMAPGLPYAIAAKVAYPDRQSIAFVGDGGFTMLMGEFATAVKYGLDIKVIIVHNNSLGQIKWEQLVFLGNPEYVCDLQDIDFAKFAEACGGVGITVNEPGEIKSAYQQAFSNGRPTVIDVYVDANEPPMPGKITFKEASHLAEALAKGTKDRGEIAMTIFRDKISELV